MSSDYTEAIAALAHRKLAEREGTRGPVANPKQWLISVIAGIRIDHAGRLATMPDGLSLAEQTRWIEHGPPAPGARIPPPREPTDFGDGFLPAEKFYAGLDAARAALRPCDQGTS